MTPNPHTPSADQAQPGHQWPMLSVDPPTADTRVDEAVVWILSAMITAVTLFLLFIAF